MHVKNEESFPGIQKSGQTEQVDKFSKIQNKAYTLTYCHGKYTLEDSLLFIN